MSMRRGQAVHCAPISATSPLATAFAMIVLLFVFAGAQESDCEYRYTEQPINDPTCSPYGDVMRINCTVEVPRDASDISIGWFLDCMELSNDSHVTIRSQDQYTDTVRRIRSQLVITDMTDDYDGEYTCNILGDEEFIPSKLLTLLASSELEVYLGLGLCPVNHTFSTEEVKCAEITENRTIPMSLSCADPVAATSHAGTTITSTPVIQSTPTPSLLATLPMSSLPISSFPSYTPSPSTPRTTTPPSSPIITDPPDSSATDDPTSIWLYVVVAVAAVFFMIIIILAIVFVGMCLRRQQNVTIDEQTLKQQGHSKQFTDNGMLENTAYQGEIDSTTLPDGTFTGSQPLRVSDASDYNTLTMGDYEVVDLPGSNYQRLQRPTLTPGMMPRFVSSTDTSVFSPTSTMASMYPHSATLNDPVKPNGTGIIPPPLPSTARRGNGNMMKLPNSPETSGTFDSAFHTGSAEVSSPFEHDRINSTSMLLPQDRKGSGTASADFEGLYSPRVLKASPTTPGAHHHHHPLQKIPETGATFPEPKNPNPFPTYETIPANERKDSTGAQYERPIPSPKKSGHPRAITLPICSPTTTSLPPSDNMRGQGATTMHANSGQSGHRSSEGAAAATDGAGSSSHPQFPSISHPVYHSLEQANDVSERQNGSATELKDISTPAYPVFETADFTASSDSSANNTLTPGFPVCSADFAGTSTGELTSGSGAGPSSQNPLHRVSNEYSSTDFTGDSDYPQLDSTTDYTGGSSTTAYPESDWTAGNSTGGDGAFTGNSTTFTFNGAPQSHSTSGSSTTSSNRTSVPSTTASNGNCSTIPGYPNVIAGSSHTVPTSSSATNGPSLGGATSHTISTPRNHYKQLDPATIEPPLKYTRLNVGKLTVI